MNEISQAEWWRIIFDAIFKCASQRDIWIHEVKRTDAVMLDDFLVRVGLMVHGKADTGVGVIEVVASTTLKYAGSSDFNVEDFRQHVDQQVEEAFRDLQVSEVTSDGE